MNEVPRTPVPSTARNSGSVDGTRRLANRDRTKSTPLIAPEAEACVMSALVRSKPVREELVPQLREGDFTSASLRALFVEVRAMHESDTPIDEVSLMDRLESQGTLGAAGGRKAVEALIASESPLATWQGAWDRLMDASRRRSLVAAMDGIRGEAYGVPSDMKSFVTQVEDAVSRVSERRDMRPYRHISSLLAQTVEEARTAASSPAATPGIETGFPVLDRMLAGLRPGQLAVVGARPAVGKTAFALSLAAEAARSDVTVALFSLEMSGKELAQRMMSAASGVSMSALRTGRLGENQWLALAEASRDLPGERILIDDAAGMTVGDIRAESARMLRGSGRGLVIIDYLQLISSPTLPGPSRTRAVEVGEISRRLKMLAKELQVPVLTLAQLSRQAVYRSGPPRLSDLRESGSIEQDADVVMFLSRRDEDDEGNEDPERKILLSVAKNRSGPIGDIDMLFVPSSTKFYEVGEHTGDVSAGHEGTATRIGDMIGKVCR